MKKTVLLFVGVLALLFSGCKKEPALFTDHSFDYFDTVTQIYGYEESEQEFLEVSEKIQEKLAHFHKLYDIYESYEGITNLRDVNEWMDEPVEVPAEIFDLLIAGQEMYELTGGKVNICMGSVLTIWHDYRSEGTEHPEQAKLPEREALLEAAAHTDFEYLVLDAERSTVCRTDPKLLLDVGALAKGYAVEQVARWMLQEGYEGYVLNVGGNVRIVGERPDGKAWSVGIENPDTDDKEHPTIETLALKNQALVTSGSYQRYYEVDGVRYHHIIDPDTWMPGENFRSVSVLCEDSGMADALSTALFTMTLEEGQKLVESLDGVEAMWVTPEGEKKYSAGFAAYH